MGLLDQNDVAARAQKRAESAARAALQRGACADDVVPLLLAEAQRFTEIDRYLTADEREANAAWAELYEGMRELGAIGKGSALLAECIEAWRECKTPRGIRLGVGLELYGELCRAQARRGMGGYDAAIVDATGHFAWLLCEWVEAMEYDTGFDDAAKARIASGADHLIDAIDALSNSRPAKAVRRKRPHRVAA